ncbi:hypothetical protein K440DRAFT_635515 [Wilcoxina mikolae CBS 423.85]|nr:hypothetical protein K440DRAFT_635515 [Wilcoxina mikolae CBS 423.85]
MLCINTKWRRTRLVQIPVRANAKDKWLFDEFRRQYFRIRGWRSICTLRTVDIIRFVRFELYYKDFVCCLNEEIPPPEIHEYEYTPRPATLLPPQGPVSPLRLLHNFEEPHICQNSCDILPKLPKKKHTPLQSHLGYVEGWGLHFEEGISVIRVILATTLLIVLTSIVWVVLWLSWKNRQDAATVAGLFGTTCSMVLVTAQLLQRSL